MSIFKKLFITGAATVLGVSAMFFGLSGSAFADCYVYNQNGFNTSATPVFNNICGVPEGIGNESDFVRIRQNTNGDDTDNTDNSAYTVGTLTSQCTTGTKYDVWNYLHNDAYSQDNDNGSGSAVAHDVISTMTAQYGTGSNFQFGDTVTANNAESVSDAANLNCDGNTVTLTLVPGSVHIASTAYGSNWDNLPDTTINNPLKLGSPIIGSGDQWGCWNYRIVVVYQVTVAAKTTPPTTPPPTTPPSTPPQTLISTGASTDAIVAAFALVTVGSALGFRYVARRRLTADK